MVLSHFGAALSCVRRVKEIEQSAGILEYPDSAFFARLACYVGWF